MSLLGREILRREDARLLRGDRCGVADLVLDGTLELSFVRSAVPHGELESVDLSAARALPGVVGAWAAADLELPPVPPFGGQDTSRPWPPLARDRVRYLGEQVAVVAAPDRYLAEDGAELARVRIRALEPVIDPRRALEPDAVRLWPEGNLVHDKHAGDPVTEALAGAEVVVEARYRQELVIHTSLEARAILVRPDGDGGITVWVSHQGQHIVRDALAGAFELAQSQVRVIVPDVGGAFGGKTGTWSEYLVVAALARRLGRPVRWVEDRREALTNGPRGRGQWQQVRLAADRTGRLVALDLDIVADIGGYPAQGATVPHFSALVACGCYDIPVAHVRSRTVTTTTAPTAAYRGAGRPEAAYQLERTMDVLARRLELDPAELRRRNLLPPEAFPHRTPTGAVYDSGNYAAAFDLLLETLDYQQARAEQRRRRAAGAAPYGIGLACYVERSGGAAHSPEWGAVEVAATGDIVAYSGSTSTGQGHETSFPQVVAARLGVEPDRVRLVARDTRLIPEGHGSFGSRSMQVGGGALWRAAGALIERGRQRFAEHHGVELGAVHYAEGMLSHPDTSAMSLAELAGATGTLRCEDVFAPPQAFPFGCYGAVVELDPGTGVVSVVRLVAVDDYGKVVNPLVVRGQTIGSIAQGLGQALYESAGYLPDGRPPAGSLLEYLIPTVAEMPPLELAETETENPHQPFGAKGAGEAGCIGAPPAVLNAIADALHHWGAVAEPALPAEPRGIWTLLATAAERA